MQYYAVKLVGLAELESQQPSARYEKPADDGQMSLADVGGADISRELRELDLDTLTPIEAMNVLYQLKKKVDG